MSVLIRGMEMPESCIKCKLCVSYKCVLTGEIRWSDEFDYDSKRFENCPLVPVPPHGRLIDADAFIELINDSTILSDFLKCIINPLIRGEPTVIEAEESE